MKRTALLITGLLAAAGVFAQATPAGLWRTIDDATKKERSLVRVTDTNGVFSARIEQLADPAVRDHVCDKCTDDRKGKPIVGLTIMRDVRKDTDSEPADVMWDGGHILDPENGKSYKVRLKLLEGGKKLSVRGYVGAPMFGRTQVWIRAE
ncbi:MAG: hypothetical protein RLZZ618_558 [Pseudomonadota bacterium]|jgi:uncharacterized protein (DUF2147 family)